MNTMHINQTLSNSELGDIVGGKACGCGGGVTPPKPPKPPKPPIPPCAPVAPCKPKPPAPPHCDCSCGGAD